MSPVRIMKAIIPLGDSLLLRRCGVAAAVWCFGFYCGDSYIRLASRHAKSLCSQPMGVRRQREPFDILHTGFSSSGHSTPTFFK